MSVWIAVVVAVFALAAFVFVRYRKGRRLPDSLQVGRALPSFEATSESGAIVRSDDLRGAPAVLLFVRGNWCPFCGRQVSQLTRSYRRIDELGARLILVTPKPLETTRRVAQFFEVDFEFWLDTDLAVARQLGLLLSNGVPASHRDEYGTDTLWPAAIVTDVGGVIRYANISKAIVDRPSPDRFVQALESMPGPSSQDDPA